MAIAFDAATDGGNNGGSTTSITFSHTCTGSDRLLIVAVIGDPTTDDVTGVTYNGVAMTQVGKQSPAIGYRWAYLYHLEAPASGANNVVISAGSAHYLWGGAASYTGVNASGQPDQTATNSGTGPTLTTSITTVADNCWMMLMEGSYDADTGHPAAGTGSTRRKNDASFGAWGLFDNNAAITPAGANSMQTVRTGPVGLSHVAASFAPATSPPPPPPAANYNLPLLGVGD